jgi:hypothetical protein
MSGSDYPIKSKSFINSFLYQNGDKIFINIEDANKVWSNFNFRIDYYRINLSSKRGDSVLLKGLNHRTIYYCLKKDINIFLKVAFKKRELSLKMKFYGGSQWWAMNISDLLKIHDFIKQNKNELFNFFAYSHVPDEFFFHSIIMYLKESGEPVLPPGYRCHSKVEILI